MDTAIVVMRVGLNMWMSSRVCSVEMNEGDPLIVAQQDLAIWEIERERRYLRPSPSHRCSSVGKASPPNDDGVR